MKIIALQAENLKRLVAVEIKPDGNLVEITGRNGQGKTSILDAIWWALEGTTHIQAEPIRKGATEAMIKLDLGQLKVTRRFRAKEEGGYTTSIVVENQEGARYSSPQAMLDALVGELAFDPLAFTRMKPADQFETLKRFVPDVDFAAIEQANKDDYAERTAVNRRAKELRAQADGIVIDGEVGERIDETALVSELQAAGEHNATLEQRKARRDQAARDILDKRREAQGLLDQDAGVKAEIDALLAKRESLTAAAGKLSEEAVELEVKLDGAEALPEPIDPAPIREKIDAARQHNARADMAARRAELERQAAAVDEKSKLLSKNIEARTEQKARAIAEAKMPVDGIGFGDGFVTLNGVPFDQGSDAERLQASIAIAAAMNPRLRVIRVRDGSLLDEDAMKLLAQFAEANDLQVWIERVDGSGRVGFVIEDGRVKQEAVAPAA